MFSHWQFNAREFWQAIDFLLAVWKIEKNFGTNIPINKYKSTVMLSPCKKCVSCQSCIDILWYLWTKRLWSGFIPYMVISLFLRHIDFPHWSRVTLSYSTGPGFPACWHPSILAWPSCMLRIKCVRVSSSSDGFVLFSVDGLVKMRYN